MRTLPGVGAVVLGVGGVLLCVAAIGLGWWVVAKTVDRVTRVAARLDRGLTEADAGLARAEERATAVRAGLVEVRESAALLMSEDPELPRVRAAVERLLDRLVPTLDRAAATADSLRSVAAGLRAAADIVDQFGGGGESPGGARTAADAIDRAADVLNVPRGRIEAVKSGTAIRLTRELFALAREVVTGSEQLADGLAAARRAIADVRGWTAEWRDVVVFRAYVAGAANTLVWSWGGLGQLCLIGWGRRLSNRGSSAA